MELSAGIEDVKAPVDPGLSLVPLQFQGLDLPAEGFLIGETLSQATAGDDAELDLRHIQPTAMLGCVVKFQPFGDAPSLRCGKDLLQGRNAVGVQIVQNQPDYRNMGIGLVHQPPHLLGEVLGGVPLGHAHISPPSQGLAEQEQVASPLPAFLCAVRLWSRAWRFHLGGRTCQ